MPVSGTAKYSGYLVGLRDFEYGSSQFSDWVDFDVDFGNKKVTGQILAGPHFDVDANIVGNRFEGTSKDGETFTKGGFYGPNAAEMAGTLTEILKNPDGTVSGEGAHTGIASFGAKKIDPRYYRTGAMPADQK